MVNGKSAILALILMVATTTALIVAQDPSQYPVVAGIILYVNNVVDLWISFKESIWSIPIVKQISGYFDPLMKIFLGIVSIFYVYFIGKDMFNFIIKKRYKYILKEFRERLLSGNIIESQIQERLTVLILIVDSIIIPTIYVTLLSFLGGYLVYLAHYIYGLSTYISVTLFINLMIVESVLVSGILYTKPSTKSAKKGKEPKLADAMPTIGIILSFPFVFLYKLIQLRDPIIFNKDEPRLLCAYIRYLLMNPIWLYDSDQKLNPFKGMGGIDRRCRDSYSLVRKRLDVLKDIAVNAT